MKRRLENLPLAEARRLLALGAISARAASAQIATKRATREFASPEHERFYQSTAPEIVASGWMGAGKSRVLCEKAYDLALMYPGAELGLFRKYGASLPATTERTFWEDVVDDRFVVARNKGEHWVDLGRRGTSSRIWFLGLDTDPVTGVPSKVGSLNLDWAGVDEAVELNEADWMILNGRLRKTTLPYRQLAAATNPADPSHWLKRRFTPPTGKREFITIVANRFLPPDYPERLADLGDDVHAQRLGKGLWVAAEGTIWYLPVEQIRTPEPQPYKRVVGGIDWGFVHPFACEIVAETGAGRLVTLDELYARNTLVEDLLPRLLELQSRYKVDTFYADPSEPEYIAACRRAGLRIEAANNAMNPGIDAVAAAIKAGEIVSPVCAGLLGELPGYTWARDRSGEVRERPVDVGDDACDAWRYAHMGLRKQEPGLLTYYRELAARRAAGPDHWVS